MSRDNPSGVVKDRLRGPEVATWTAVAGAAFAVLIVTTGGPHLGEDSYQYLRVADNLATGKGISTDLVHFDVERAHGRIPAPLTTFPPGFPATVAVLRAVGLPSPIAAVVVASIAATLTVALLAFAGNILGVDRSVARLALLAFVVNANTLLYASAVSSESLFTLFVLAAILLLLRAEKATPSLARLLYLGAGVVAGCAYWIRYAGLLVFAGMVVALSVLLLSRRTRRDLEALALVVVPALLMISVGFARNVRLTGGWQGGTPRTPTMH